MNAQTNVRSMRAATRYTYSAWKVGAETRLCYPLDVGAADHIDEAVQAALLGCSHKDVFFVRQHDTFGDDHLVSMCVVKARKVWRKCPATMVTKQFNDLYADEMALFQVKAFAPAEPWRWTPGSDVVGHSGVLEA